MPLRPPPDAEDKLRDIRSVTDEALSHLGADELLAALLDRVRAVLDADTAARDRVFTADDAALLQLAADRAAMAVQSLRALEDHAGLTGSSQSRHPTTWPGSRCR